MTYDPLDGFACTDVISAKLNEYVPRAGNLEHYDSLATP